MFLKVDNVGTKRMCSERLFQAIGSATQNVVIGANKWCWWRRTLTRSVENTYIQMVSHWKTILFISWKKSSSAVLNSSEMTGMSLLQ